MESATWQPIETAPKDGTNIFLFSLPRQEAVYDCRWGAYGWEWYGWDGQQYDWSSFQDFAPTHWMPIPAPPEEDA